MIICNMDHAKEYTMIHMYNEVKQNLKLEM